MENGKHFIIRNITSRNVTPEYSKKAGIDNATVAIYGCDNFVLDNIKMSNSAGILIGYGVVKCKYLSIPQNFRLNNITLNNSQLGYSLRGIQISTFQRGNASITEESSAYEIQVAQLDDQLRKCHITSPICGTVLAKYAEAGELATQGKPLFKVADVQHLFLRAYITADQLSQLKLGDKVKVFSDLGEDDRREYEGTITWISDKSEFTPKTIQTRDERANLVYATKIAVKNDGYIKIGMYGEMKK